MLIGQSTRLQITKAKEEILKEMRNGGNNWIQDNSKQRGGKLERAGKQLGGGKRERERIRGKDDRNVWQCYDIKLKN